MGKRDGATAILLFAHGSSVEEANQGVHDLAAKVEALGRYGYVRAAFLDVTRPTLADAVMEAVGVGMQRVIIIPFFLTLGIHLRRDLPNLVAPIQQAHPEVEIEVGQSLEGHPLMADLILSRIREVTGTA